MNWDWIDETFVIILLRSFSWSFSDEFPIEGSSKINLIYLSFSNHCITELLSMQLLQWLFFSLSLVCLFKIIICMLQLSIIIKDAGFVYESFRNEMKRTFLTFFSYKTNPRNESFENCVTKRIHETNLLNTVVRNESTKRIFWKLTGFANPEVQDSYGFVSL